VRAVTTVQGEELQPDYPGHFSGLLHAGAWLQEFIGWHNDDHQHSGLALFTPADVFFARIGALARPEAGGARRRLRPATRTIPQRPAKAALPPAEVNINPIEVLAVTVN
jgi:putative transposase